MPVKIGFQVISCSGEDVNFRSSELNYHGPTVRGWRSSANSSYPQEIVLQLKVYSVLHQIQILAHQYLILTGSFNYSKLFGLFTHFWGRGCVVYLHNSFKESYPREEEEGENKILYGGGIAISLVGGIHEATTNQNQKINPQKIEICTSNRSDQDFSSAHDSGRLFEYLGFVTFSDNKATGFRSRELKSVLIPSKKAKYIKLVIHSNHVNVKNIHNQVSLIAVNVLGDELLRRTKENELNNNICCHATSPTPRMSNCNSNYTSPYDDLAFEMYTDEEIAKIMKIIEAKKVEAVYEERFEYANALKITLENLKAAGEILGLYEQEKKHAIKFEDYDKAKSKKLQIDNFRQTVYSALHIDQLLQPNDVSDEEDGNSTLSNYQRSPSRHASHRDRSLPARTYDNTSDYEDEISLNTNRIPFHTPRKTTRHSQNRSTNHLTHSKSQISFSDDPIYSIPVVSTSKSNPHINRYLRETNPDPPDVYANGHSKGIHRPPHDQDSLQSLDDGAETFDRIQTPSSNSSDPDDLSQIYNKFSLPNDTVRTKSPSKSERNVRVRDESQTEAEYLKTTSLVNFSMSQSLKEDLTDHGKLKTSVSEQFGKTQNNSSPMVKSSFEAYEDRMLPALRSYNGNEIVRECQLAFEQPRKSTLNEREKKQAVLPISVFGIEMIEKFYSKSFNDKEEGLKQLQQELKKLANPVDGEKQPSFNKTARAAIFLLHRALRDKVYSVYSSAAETVRLFFTEFAPQRVSSSEIARSVEKLLPELLTKSGDPTPRIHNMAAHTLLSMTECEEVRRLNIIQTHLSRPLTSGVHPRLALSRLEMVEQLILNHGISKDKRSGLTCRTLAEFGSSGLHHPAEPVRKVSERILIQVYKVNPRIVRKQLPPDDHVTRRNLLYRQLFQEFDFMDMQRKLTEQSLDDSISLDTSKVMSTKPCSSSQNWDNHTTKSLNGGEHPINGVREETRGTISIPNSNAKAVKDPFLGSLGERDKPGKPGGNITNGIAPHNLEKLKSIMFGSKKQSNGSQHFERLENTRLKGTAVLPKGKKVTIEEASTSTTFPRKTVENGDETLKFPSLVDSICTTKARLMMDQNKSTKPKPPDYGISKDQISYPPVKKPQKMTNGQLEKEIKRETSNIPLPTFGTNRKASTNPSKKLQKQELPNKILSKIPKNRNQKPELLNRNLRSNESTDDTNHVKMMDAKREVLERLEKKQTTPTETSLNGKNQMSKSSKTPNLENECQLNSVLSSKDKTTLTLKKCIFCLSTKKWSTEEALNNHYLNTCPMLTTCRYCMEVIEIQGYINHLLGDCSEKHLFQKCTNCQEAILQDLFPTHECKASSDQTNRSRCPFCHNDIEPGESSWRSHLMGGSDICQNHPRLKKTGLPL